MPLISRALAVTVQKEIGDAARAIFEKHGLEFAGVRASYGDDLNVKVTGHLVQLDESGVNRADPEVVAYERYADVFRLPKDGIGKTFRSNGHTFTVAGLNPKARSMPVIATREDGKKFKFAAENVSLFLNAARG